jgi:hypothetical protein
MPTSLQSLFPSNNEHLSLGHIGVPGIYTGRGAEEWTTVTDAANAERGIYG